MEGHDGSQGLDPTQQSPFGRFMGMRPASSLPDLTPPPPASDDILSAWRGAGYRPSAPVGSPLLPRNLLEQIGRSQVDEDSAASDDSDGQTENQAADYESWSADQVRKEYTRRGLKLKASMKKGKRIVVLRRHDIASAAYDGLLLGDDGGSTGGNTRWTKHCWYRLLNILFADEFATRFSQSGNLASRAELDSKEVSGKSSFWQDVTAAYIQQYEKTHERSLLMFNDDMFAGINPSVVKHHPAENLLKMAKELIRNYFIAEQRFTTSGQNENEFWKFVDKRGAVLYMRMWLKLKPDLINFVRCGLFKEDEVDTLDGNTLSREDDSDHTKPKQAKTGEHVARMASAVLQYVTDRKTELQHATKSTQLQERSQMLSILGDIRRPLGEIDSAIARSDGQSLQRLEEDRTLLLEERQSWIDKLRSRDN